jgi:PEP-CTERM motif
MKLWMKTTLLASALAFAGQVQAATFNLNLTGTLANTTFNSFPFMGDTINTGNLVLDGLNSFVLNQGDVVNATVTFDGSYMVPGTAQMFVGFNLFQDGGAVQPSPTPSTSGLMTFFNSGPTGLPNDTVTTGCGNCLSSIAFLGAQGPVSFFQLQTSFTIDTLADMDFLINGASVSYQLRDLTGAVPEPASWALMILGFGAVGSAMRRRSKVRGMSFA